MYQQTTNEMRSWSIIVGTLLCAMVLTLLPMPTWVLAFRPAWVLLVLIFWGMVLPGRISLTLAWILGLFLDVLNGTLLGEHALAMTAIIYLVARLASQLLMFTLFQQGMAVLLLVLFYQFILFCIQGFLGDLSEGWLYWLPAFTSMLLWPWVFIIMRGWYRRFEA